MERSKLHKVVRVLVDANGAVLPRVLRTDRRGFDSRRVSARLNFYFVFCKNQKRPFVEKDIRVQFHAIGAAAQWYQVLFAEAWSRV